MMEHKRKGYLLVEIVIATAIVAILASFVGSTFVSVAKDNRSLRAEKELREVALHMENIIKSNVKKSNSLSQIIFNDIMIEDFEIDQEYEADAIAFDRKEKSTQYINSFRRLAISKTVWTSLNEKKSLWIVNMRDDIDLSKAAIKNASKYEAGNYLKSMYIKVLDQGTYDIKIQLELNEVLVSHSFICKTI